MRFRRWPVLLLSATLTLAMLEAGLRLFPLPLPDRFFEPQPDYGWFHIPGRTGWQATTEFKVPVAINSQGLRDVEHQYEKPEGVYRVLILGDSFPEGLQVPLEDTVGRVLERRLNASSPANYEVVNAGVSRFGTDNELLFYLHEGARYQPDLVLLFFFYNDLLDNLERPYFQLEEGRLVPVEPKPVEVLGPWGELRGWLWDQFRLYQLTVVAGGVINALLEDGSTAGPNPLQQVFRVPQTQEQAAAWRLAGALLVELEHAVRRDGGRLVVVGIDDEVTVMGNEPPEGYDYQLANTKLRDLLDEKGIIHIDLLPGFRSHYFASGLGLFWPGDGHWNSAGHQRAAEIVHRALEELGIVVSQEEPVLRMTD